ncbi:fatty acid/phospholipid synthesis [Lactobacillus phage ATCC 8014-B2]|uniref:Fatty acid/phospholipid synthesis n=1 Tax=Lactobacillus phage ATCC 8014-B2 TaxID=1225795 RepID=K4ID28_9CAUD|nr:fatty acid/phospholipid synthesis [Lactobacillus phage ATCC 8014-B2]AFU63079.1 fatty acid/phospholipid synthesis [Lactobacillus phage ATCC 8014-B2]
MDSRLTQKGLDENLLLEELENCKELEYDDGVIAKLGSVDEILKYGMLVPESENSRHLAYIIYGIQQGYDISEQDSKFLDSIDSRFIGHNEKKDLTKREILCLFLNQYWDWSKLEWYNDRDTSVVIKDLFKEYSKFCADHRFGTRTRKMKYDDFRDYMSKYGILKRDRQKVNGKEIDRYVIQYLPAYKDSLKEVPDFDLSKHKEIKEDNLE